MEINLFKKNITIFRKRREENRIQEKRSQIHYAKEKMFKNNELTASLINLRMMGSLVARGS